MAGIWGAGSRGCLGVLALFVAGLSAGCASDVMLPVRNAYEAGDYDTARDVLLELQTSDPSNGHLYGLELGVVQQARKDPEAAVTVLRTARDGMDEISADSFSDWAASTFLDDRSRSYPGADYEHVLVRALLALFDLMAGGHDAFAYGLQVLEKQQEIIRSFQPVDGKNPKEAYKLVAFGNYLRGIIVEQDPRGRSEARREFEKVRELAPEFAPAVADVERTTRGRFAAPGNGVVHVIALVGRGPLRVEVEEHLTRDILALAQVIWAVHQKQPILPNFVSLRIPALAFRKDNPEGVHVYAGSQSMGVTAVLTDIEATAKAEFDAMKRYTTARAVVRRILKVAMVTAGKEVLAHNRSDNSSSERAGTVALQLGIDVLGNLWAATEHADLRCWQLLPASIQVLRIELPAGDHEIRLVPIRGGVPIGTERGVRVQVVAGYNTYVTALLPNAESTPPVMTSRPAQ